MTQQQLADKADCGVSGLRKVERGERELSQDWRASLSKALDCRPEDLLGGNGPLTTVAEDGPNGTDRTTVNVDQVEIRGPVRIEEGGQSVFQNRGVTAVRAVFGFPTAGFRDIYGAESGSVVIIEVRGDEAAPELPAGQRVLIDTSDVTPSPPGIFIVWDGLAMVVRRVQFLAHSAPPTVRIVPINPAYLPYDRALGEAFIQGRIVGLWRRY